MTRPQFVGDYRQRIGDFIVRALILVKAADDSGLETAAVTLSFWLHIDTDETTTSKINDTLKVQVLGTTGKMLATLATYSNLDAALRYALLSSELAAPRSVRRNFSR